MPNYLNNNNAITLIGNFDEQNHFKIKFILSYNKEKDRKNHLNNNLNQFLDNLSLVNNSSPISSEKEKSIKIGTIYKYDQYLDKEIIKYNIDKKKEINKDNNKEKKQIKIKVKIMKI